MCEAALHIVAAADGPLVLHARPLARRRSCWALRIYFDRHRRPAGCIKPLQFSAFPRLCNPWQDKAACVICVGVPMLVRETGCPPGPPRSCPGARARCWGPAAHTVQTSRLQGTTRLALRKQTRTQCLCVEVWRQPHLQQTASQLLAVVKH